MPAFIEAMENRLLMSVTTWTANSITDVQNNEFAAIQYGDDGYPYGIATGIAGQGYDQDIWTSNVWDDNPDDGVDSGWRAVNFSVNASNDGQMSLSVDGDSPVTYDVGTDATVHSVTIQADVAYGGLMFSWSDVTVSFYHNGSLVDTQHPADISAGDLNSSSQDPSETGEVISTSANADGASIQGQVRLQAAAGVYPGANDVFGQVSIS